MARSKSGCPVRIPPSCEFGLRRDHYVEEEVCVAVDEARQERGSAQVQHSGLGRRMDLRRRPNLSDLSIFDQNRSRG
ncbi:hypothetical protein BSZ22_12410 [Bradyrhizobium canariense]|uniref:Uncharacterized protein n=1 Tax=Bradyrhizobium canariense TaxID=255045 RepID=A0A1X3FWF5_9BRAD|nr:hypothetical protein BSZ22_12410 [Bradyrhizobium canariense]OSI79531.1 hypothetical protein BSZ23_14100 [Bradyrhizobium canariense]OSI91214.1 hypothetical protein BSZ24_17900 [Bradyrhizobium canariense]OSI91838.1 hypothetical protein BSZ25_13745 [Bradyrhizobium canariense]OSJ05648.1 hypothetical protein BSZ16_11530 [Bradyrhizobium canariense]